MLGNEKIDSVEAYVVELSKADKTKAKFFIHTKSNLIYKVQDEKGFRIFAHYSLNNGFVFPKYVLESNPKQDIEIRFNSMAFNTALSDSLFVIPQQAYDKKKVSIKSLDRFTAQGDSLYKRGQHAPAVQAYTDAIKEDNKSFHAFNGRGLLK